jgi:ribosomal protein S18 acetylase RimI-like enzyme
MGELTRSSALRIKGMAAESRKSLGSILDQSFTGIYRWHAKRILRSVRWVRMAIRGDAQVGLTMLTMLGQRSGYIYYIAVTPSWRAGGVGGLLLDDALKMLRAEGARETFACVRADNEPSIRLLHSRGFIRMGFRERVRTRGLMNSAILWMRMVVAPGEKVFVRVCPIQSAQRSGADFPP